MHYVSVYFLLSKISQISVIDLQFNYVLLGNVIQPSYFYFVTDVFCIWGIFKSLLNLLQYCICFMFWFLVRRHVESSSLTRDPTHSPSLKGEVLTSGLPESPQHFQMLRILLVHHLLSPGEYSMHILSKHICYRH